MSRQLPAASRPVPGFTLIELLLVVAIAGVLIAAAVPTFGDYLRRARIVEAATRLSDYRVRMEQYFLDNRRYDDGAGGCGLAAPPPGPADSFALECIALASTYAITARGIAATAMAGFAYAIDQTGAQRTVAVPDGWVAIDTCWVVRRDGSCV